MKSRSGLSWAWSGWQESTLVDTLPPLRNVPPGLRPGGRESPHAEWFRFFSYNQRYRTLAFRWTPAQNPNYSNAVFQASADWYQLHIKGWAFALYSALLIFQPLPNIKSAFLLTNKKKTSVHVDIRLPWIDMAIATCVVISSTCQLFPLLICTSQNSAHLFSMGPLPCYWSAPAVWSLQDDLFIVYSPRAVGSSPAIFNH